MNKLSNKQNKKAFTIIEVVLVLAVAGLIFLVVFQAIPRLQRSRRDNERKRDLESILALAVEYESNTGTLPTAADVHAAFNGTTSSFSTYIDDDPDIRKDPSGTNYVGDATPIGELGHFRWYVGGWKCSPTANWVSDSSSRGFAYIALERGYYCLDGF